MSSLIERYLREPFINVLCVELGIELRDYKLKRNVSIAIGVIIAILAIFSGIVFANVFLIVSGIVSIYIGYRLQYWRIKRLERKTRDQLLSVYPILVQTFISLLYTNDNLIKVFLLLENYHYHPYIDRALVILINKYQLNPENSELIFAEFCNIFETSSASLLHQLLVNINEYGVNDNEISLLEAKIETECDKYISAKTLNDGRKIFQIGAVGVTAFICLLLVIIIAAV
ncbi:hypothetical protein RZE82_08045 [Mollicutes bacterium LVI A0039]|nr:hypothetical protein RZE82_08045 [Mollicutes bacterium LVI A0039]